MKIFSRKKTHSGQKKIAPSGDEPEKGFYEHSASEAPLDEYTDGYGRQIRRTSRHTPARRRENNNRASHRELTFLMLKVVLIPALVVVAFFGLKFGLSLVDGPSERDRETWETSEKLMEQGGVPVSAPAGESQVLASVSLEERMAQWAQAERHLRAAQALEQRGIGAEAVSRLQQALQYVPENRVAQELLLKIYMQQQNFSEAVPLCIRLLDQDSQSWGVKMDLLKALQALDETGVAVILAEQMLVEQPGDLVVLEFAAYAYAAEGEVELALELYDRILQDNRSHLLALEGSGYIYQWLKEWQKAVPYYLELLKADPKAEHYHALARCYAKQQQESKAVIFLGQAASLYGEAMVSPWLREPEFDIVRETVDFRALTDRIVGLETRKAIESIRRREVEKQVPAELEDFKLLERPDLEILRPKR